MKLFSLFIALNKVFLFISSSSTPKKCLNYIKMSLFDHPLLDISSPTPTLAVWDSRG